MGLFDKLFKGTTEKKVFVPDLHKTEYDNWLDYLASGGTSDEWKKLIKENKWRFKKESVEKSGTPKRKKISNGGDIAYYELNDWWVHELNATERDIIRNRYCPMGTDKAIDEGNISYCSQSKLAFLGCLADWFKKKEDYSIAKKILLEGEKEYDKNKDVLDKHFFCLSGIRIHYANRDEDENALNKAIMYCERQIALAPEAKKAFINQDFSETLPRHTGYQQLAIIYEKEKRYDKAIEITRQALEQGWNIEDCEKRLERLEKKQANKISKN